MELPWVVTEKDWAVLQSPGELARRELVLSERLHSSLPVRPRPVGHRAARGSARDTCPEQVNLE